MNTLFDIPIARLCLSKLEGIVIRLLDVIRLLPIRLWRICLHFKRLGVRIYRRPKSLFQVSRNFFWLIELAFYVFDLVGLAEIYESIADIVKFNSRPLSREEADAVKVHFGKSLNLKRIRIDNFAFGGPKSHHFAYVSFYTINCWGPLTPDIFIHEIMHIWQYEQMGAVYIPRALKAQFSSEGYDYGGFSNLLHAIKTGRGLHHLILSNRVILWLTITG